jgi:hypothetical protein
MIDTKITALITHLEALREANNHSEAYLQIAKYFKYKKFSRLFASIIVIRDIENGLPHEVRQYQYRLYNEMFEQVKKDHGQQVYDAVYGAT